MSRLEFNQPKKGVSRKTIIVGLLASLFLIISSITLLLYPFASKEKEEYFSGTYPILFQEEQTGNGYIDGETVYVPIKFVQTYIDESIHFDQNSNSVIITTEDKVIQMPSESLSYYVNETAVKLQMPALTLKNGESYIALNTILSLYPIEFNILKDSNAIWITKDGEELTLGNVTNKNVHEEKLRLRTKPDLQAPFTAQTLTDEEIYIESEIEDYYFVRKQDGVAGYISKDYVIKKETKTVKVTRDVKNATLPKLEGPIHITWEAVYSSNPDTDRIPEMPGVNVVSPTWFKLSSDKGDISNLGSLEYSQWAKARGYQVWGLFSNDFDPELTHEAFKDFEKRQTMIRQLLHYSQIYELNGINIDIENVNPEDGPLVTQFVREATPYFHEAGLYVSMDITFISSSGNWSTFYERDKLSQIVDYMVVMAYDEHWGSSPVAGSVASFPWVEKNLKRLLEVVPNDKLILGVPLYTRIWKEQTTEDGKIEVSSKAYSMSQVKEWMLENKLKPNLDPLTGQNYAEYRNEEEKATYKVWIEDELSLKKRAELSDEYKLAGIATWSRYFADETAWSALNLEKTESITKK